MGLSIGRGEAPLEILASSPNRFTSHSPLNPGRRCFAGKKLLHGGLFEVALLGDELVQRSNQGIHIGQRRGDGSLFVQWAVSGSTMSSAFPRK